MEALPSKTHGYPTDVPYVRTFIRGLAPAWLDHVAIVSGVIPPTRDAGFAFCELGCGQGVTTEILAATHPHGCFYGIDAMPLHIEHARRFATEAETSNVNFYAADFSTATSIELPDFDYITVHGVYSWVSEESRADLRAFIDWHLKPGGLVYISYNAIPGRAADLPFQRLVRALGSTFHGDSMGRFTAATKIVDKLASLKPPAFVGSSFLPRLRNSKKDFTQFYLVHELMSQNWQALGVTQVRAELATIGLAPVGSATLVQNFDSLVLGRDSRKALATISDDDARELARDFLINQSFRCDLFVRAGVRMNEDERRQRLLASTYALARPRRVVKYTMATPAGLVRFDNSAARGIVSVLSAGPASLAEIIAKSSLPGQDALANLLVLCAANAVWPVEQRHASVLALNEAIRRRLGGPEELLYLALPCGTALALNNVLTALVKGDSVGKHRDWQSFLCSHGLPAFATRAPRRGATKERLRRRMRPTRRTRP